MHLFSSLFNKFLIWGDNNHILFQQVPNLANDNHILGFSPFLSLSLPLSPLSPMVTGSSVSVKCR